MHKLNQKGSINPLVVALVFATVLMIVASILAVVNYTNFVDQRDNNQPKIEAAVEEAEAAQKAELDAEFAEKAKQPNDTYLGPSEYGSVKMTYPKTWSVYVDKGSNGLDFYAHPAFVPANDVNYALRMEVISKEFSNEIKSYDSQVKKGDLKASSVKVSGISGTRLDGFLERDQEGSMVIFPLRDKTLKVWTENKEFRGDFNNIVLKKLSFIP
jgi:hypothetical protein